MPFQLTRCGISLFTHARVRHSRPAVLSIISLCASCCFAVIKKRPVFFHRLSEAHINHTALSFGTVYDDNWTATNTARQQIDKLVTSEIVDWRITSLCRCWNESINWTRKRVQISRHNPFDFFSKIYNDRVQENATKRQISTAEIKLPTSALYTLTRFLPVRYNKQRYRETAWMPARHEWQ